MFKAIIVLFIFANGALSPLLAKGKTTFEVSAFSGAWYEPKYGEQTLFMDANGSCTFIRGRVTLFDTKTCHWNTRGEMILTYHGSQSKVFMLPKKKKLLMANNPALLSKYAAQTSLVRTDDPDALSQQGQKPLLGEWEARDHSMGLSLLPENRCRYLKGSDEVFTRSQCSWSAGSEGATLIFTDPLNTGVNVALFVKLIGNRLLAARDKSNLLPTRAKMQMIRALSPQQ